MSDFCACHLKGPVKGTLGGGTVCSKCNKSREPARLPFDPEATAAAKLEASFKIEGAPSSAAESAHWPPFDHNASATAPAMPYEVPTMPFVYGAPSDYPEAVPEHIDDSPMPTGTDEIDEDREPTVVPGEMRAPRFVGMGAVVGFAAGALFGAALASKGRDDAGTKTSGPPIDPADVNDRTGHVLAEICDERFHQEVLKSQGRFPNTCADDISPLKKLAILGEEFGEVCRAVNEIEGIANDKHFADARAALKKELTQVAAVCVAWLESL